MHKTWSTKWIRKPLENLSCGFESLRPPPADDQLWQIQNAQNSNYVPPNIGSPPGAAGARFSGGRIAEIPKMQKMKVVALIELFRMVQVRLASSAWLRRYAPKHLVGGTTGLRIPLAYERARVDRKVGSPSAKKS